MGFNQTRTQLSRETPFDNSTNGFASTEAQSAIEEAKATAEGKARYCVMCGFDGTGSTGRWLEFNGNVPSNTSPLVIPRGSILKELSMAIGSSGSITATIFKNGSALQTISISANVEAVVSGLNHALIALDNISVKITAGSGSRPLVSLFLQVA